MYFGTWDEKTTEESTLSLLKDLSLAHALEGGKFGKEIASLIQENDFAALVAYELPLTRMDWDVSQLIHCRQALAFYQKLNFLGEPSLKRQRAIDSFFASEATCKETNRLFLLVAGGQFNFLPRYTRILYAARKKISRILGSMPSIESFKFRFGPGSTTSIRKREANPQRKFSQTPRCSYELLRHWSFPSVVRELLPWLDCHQISERIDEEGYLCGTYPFIVTSGKLKFVPKNAKTYRSIVVEPTLNTLLQAGTGDYMTSRLLRAGIDIRDQSKNQRLARVGSVTDQLATLDLHAASDSISTQLVKFLLPEEWFDWLNAIRSHSATLNGSRFDLQKFSSMGNGFTFPLETLIFWALTASACEGNVDSVSVYGDDIICPRERSDDVVDILTMCGFKINLEKSFVEGPFRESCGCDYYKGIDIRPFYQKEPVDCRALFLLHNFYFRDFEFRRAEAVLEYIPDHLRIFGPDGFGDGHLLAQDWPRRRTRLIRRSGWRGYFFDTFRLLGVKQISLFPGDYVTPLYSVYVKDRGPLVEGLRDLSEVPEIPFSRDGRPYWAQPGTSGYEKISIYTLD